MTSTKSLHLHSGYVKIALEHGPVEIVELPITNIVIFHSYKNLPEGMLHLWNICLHLPHIYGPVMWVDIPAQWSIWDIFIF